MAVTFDDDLFLLLRGLCLFCRLLIGVLCQLARHFMPVFYVHYAECYSALSSFPAPRDSAEFFFFSLLFAYIKFLLYLCGRKG